MQIASYFRKENLEEILTALGTFPLTGGLSLGTEEVPSTRDVPIEDSVQASRFLKSNEVGFFIHSSVGLMNVALRNHEFSTLHFYLKDEFEHLAKPLVELLASCPTEFGYAAQAEEFKHRNRLELATPTGSFEALIGKRLENYIPGLYFITYFSSGQIVSKRINAGLLRQEAVDTFSTHNGSVVIKFFDDHKGWREHAERLDELCAQVEGIFSKRLTNLESIECSDALALIQHTAKWP